MQVENQKFWEHLGVTKGSFIVGRVILQLLQEGYIEEMSTCFYLDTALLKSSVYYLKHKYPI